MKIAETAVKRPVAITMIMMIIIVLGMTMLFKLPIQLFPDMEMPIVSVSTKYFGASPQDIETQVTKKLEDQFASLDDVDTISSTSAQDVSTIMIQFNWGADLDLAAIDVQSMVDEVKKDLPSDLTEEPVVKKVDPNSKPALQFALAGEGKNFSLSELYQIADKELKPELEKIKGVSSVSIVGGRENEVKVLLNPTQMNYYGLSSPQVLEVIAKDSRNYAVGKLDEGSKEISIRATGEISRITDLEKLTFNTPTGTTVYLSDFATIKVDNKATDENIYFNGEKALGIFVYKQKDANTVELSKQVNETIERVNGNQLKDLKIEKILDDADFINTSINNLIKTGVIGAILAISILYLFLGKITSTLVVGIAIPTTIIATFAAMYFGGISINLITLGALGLAIGMIVDDAIVVMQNIFRLYHEEGMSIFDAAVQGTKQVGMAVLASTATRVIVFLPMMFVGGMAAQIFNPLAQTVVITLIISTTVAISIIPMLSSVLLKAGEKQAAKEQQKFAKVLKLLEKASEWINSYIEKLEKGYSRLLDWSLNHQKSVLSIALVVFLLGVAFVPFVGGEFLPKMDSGEFTVEVEMPSGTQVEETDQLVKKMLQSIESIPEVEKYLVTLGADKNATMKIDKPDYAMIDVTLAKRGQRKKSTTEIVDELRQAYEGLPGVDIKLQEKGFVASSLFSSDPVYIMIKGNDADQLKLLVDEITGIVKDVPGTREVENSYGQGRPEAKLSFDREKLKQYGLDLFTVSKTLRTAVDGEVASVYRSNGEELDIRVQYMEEARQSLQDINEVYVMSPTTGTQIPLSLLADVEQSQSPTTIYREDKVRMAYVTSAIFDRDLQSVNNDIMKEIDKLNLPDGFSIEFGGESKDMKESFSDLGKAFILAVVLIYMVMAAEFESFKHPFVIMFTLPLTFFGVTSSLVLTGRSLSVPALLGVIMLVGIVVSNGIVLIEYTNQLRKEGLSVKEALLKAGPTRLHPILMTTLTTVLGLFPLALGIGEGSETHAPMATVVVGGLTVSTLLTLVVIPVVYTLFEREKKTISYSKEEDVTTGI